MKIKVSKKLVVMAIILLIGIIGSLIQVSQSTFVMANSINTDLIDFHVGVREENIRYGTAPFDDTDGNGLDSNDSNQIVRSFDRATYTINITANPTIEGSVRDVVVRVWGELEGAIASDGRVNAVFSDRQPGEVKFDYNATNPEESKSTVDFNYKLDRVGEAVSLPIDIAVQGAHDNEVIRPNLYIQVIEVDGEDVTDRDIKVHLDDLPSFTTSARVQFRAEWRGLVGGGLSTATVKDSLTNPDPEESGWYRTTGMDFILSKLPERPTGDMRGATFPSGKIYFDYEIHGQVNWWENPDATSATRREPMVFSREDVKEPQIVHVTDINGSGRRTFSSGYPGLLWENESFSVIAFNSFATGRSRMSNFNQDTIEREYAHRVWESGKYDVDPLEIVNGYSGSGRESIIHQAEVEDYFIGYTFPGRRSTGSGGWIIPSSERTVYSGLDMDISTSGGLMNARSRPAFSTQAIVLYLPNEYRHGTHLNPNNINNEEVYTFVLNVKGYEDQEGNFKEMDSGTSSFTHTLDNRGRGSINVNNQFRGANINERADGSIQGVSTFAIANEQVGDATVSTGDAQLIQGNNAWINGDLRISNGLGSRGGVDHLTRFNTDTFKITKQLADYIETEAFRKGYDHVSGTARTSSNFPDIYETMEVKFGVPNFSDFSFEGFLNKGQADYTWFDKEEISDWDKVGAIVFRVFDHVSNGGTTRSYGIPLYVHDQSLGVVNSSGTPSLISTGGYAYFNGRDREPTVTNHVKGNFNNHTEYDQDFNITRNQSPVGGSVTFTNLAIVPGRASGTFRSERSSMYSNESNKFIGTAQLELPQSYTDNSQVRADPYLTVEHTLPQGLRYVGGSGVANGRGFDPISTINNDDTQTLKWRIHSGESRNVDFEFRVSVNPFGLNGNSSQTLNVTQLVSHELDKDLAARPRARRTQEANVNILRIGQVGIFGELSSPNGAADDGWTYRLRPYTTLEDEHSVKAVWTLPYNGDTLGSAFSGEIIVGDIKVNGREDFKVYYHEESLNISNPNDIDLSNGWTEWSGESSNIGTLYFSIENPLSARDQVEFSIDLYPLNSRIGDSYVHQSSINTAVGYSVSPVTERERYRIVPDLQLGFSFIRIDTKSSADGLVVEVGIDSQVFRERALTENFNIELHEVNNEGESIERVASINTNLNDLNALEVIELDVSPEKLESNSKKTYEARLSGINTERISFFDRDHSSSIDTTGYTATELNLMTDLREDGVVAGMNLDLFEGVIRTERYAGEEIREYNEYITVFPSPIRNTKSGYGVEWTYNLVYSSDLAIEDLDVESLLFVEAEALEGSYEVTVLLDRATEEEKQYKVVPIEQKEPDNLDRYTSNLQGNNYRVFAYTLHEVFIKDGSGEVITNDEFQTIVGSIEAGGTGLSYHEGGRRLYTPVWPEELGEYRVKWEVSEGFGVNDNTLEIWDSFNIEAYMFGHIGSETIEKDEIIFSPIDPAALNGENNFPESDLDWLKGVR